MPWYFVLPILQNLCQHSLITNIRDLSRRSKMMKNEQNICSMPFFAVSFVGITKTKPQKVFFFNFSINFILCIGLYSLKLIWWHGPKLKAMHLMTIKTLPSRNFTGRQSQSIKQVNFELKSVLQALTLKSAITNRLIPVLYVVSHAHLAQVSDFFLFP